MSDVTPIDPSTESNDTEDQAPVGQPGVVDNVALPGPHPHESADVAYWRGDSTEVPQ